MLDRYSSYEHPERDYEQSRREGLTLRLANLKMKQTEMGDEIRGLADHFGDPTEVAKYLVYDRIVEIAPEMLSLLREVNEVEMELNDLGGPL